jgi:riboflavin kinase / FMN adenylyltransferase
MASAAKAKKMQITWNLNDYTSQDPTVVTLGTFDGVHLGHQELIQQVCDQAQARDLRAVAVTFEPHPQLVLQGPKEPAIRVLTTIEEKIARLSATDLDSLIVIPFLPAFAEMSPKEFVEQILIKHFRMEEIFIGPDHAFGRGRSGNVDLLRSLAAEKEFRVTALAPIYRQGQIVSSTRIRSLLQEAHIELAAELLGRPYSLQGRVIRGDGRGRELGFPTVNLRPYSEYKLLPQDGIYLSRFWLDQRAYPSVAYIGTRPTFGLQEQVLEAHVIGFDAEIYGREVNMEFLKYLRPDAKFATAGQLVEQIQQDVNSSLELYRTMAS